jgi:hypothetical protein
VSVAFTALGFALPTFSFGFYSLSVLVGQALISILRTWKSFFLLSFFFFELAVMMAFESRPLG